MAAPRLMVQSLLVGLVDHSVWVPMGEVAVAPIRLILPIMAVVLPPMDLVQSAFWANRSVALVVTAATVIVSRLANLIVQNPIVPA